MKKLLYLLFISLLCIQQVDAQSLTGKVTDADSTNTPLFQAKVVQEQNGKILATTKTYFDGTYSIKVKPGQTYQLKISFPGRADTTVSISIDKHGTLYNGTMFIAMIKDGMRLTGFIMDRVQDIPIRDVGIIIRDVMTRKEAKCITGTDGAYNLKLDYETNYTVRIDKMSPGILNKFADTSFTISTIGFNEPLDFRMDIKLRPVTGLAHARPEYNPGAKPDNKNLKPALVVLGIKDSLLKHEQDSVMASLSKKQSHKDSAIAKLNKPIKDTTTVKVEHVLSKEEQIKMAEAAKMADEVRKRKQQLEEEHHKAELAKAETELKAKKQAEQDSIALSAKGKKETEPYKKAHNKATAESGQKAKGESRKDSIVKHANKDLVAMSVKGEKETKTHRKKHGEPATESGPKVRAESRKDSLLKQSKKDIVAASAKESKKGHHKPATESGKKVIAESVKDSLHNQAKKDILSVSVKEKKETKSHKKAKDKLAAEIGQKVKTESGKDNQLKTVALDANKRLIPRSKLIEDSISQIEYQIPVKSDIKITPHKDSPKIQPVPELNSKQANKLANTWILQDSTLISAEAQKKGILAHRKHVLDSMMSIATERTHIKTDIHRAEKLARQKDSIKIQKAILAEKIKSIQQDRLQAEQDTLLREAEAIDKEIMARRKHIRDSLAMLEDQLLQTKRERQKAQELKDMSEKQVREKEVEDKRLAELALKEKRNRERAELKKAKGGQGGADIHKTGHYVPSSKAQPGKEQIPVKKVQQETESKLIIEKPKVDTVGKAPKKENKSVENKPAEPVKTKKTTETDVKEKIKDQSFKAVPEAKIKTKEQADFEPSRAMVAIQFEKNSSKMPLYMGYSLDSMITIMKNNPDLKLELYGFASQDEDQPMKLSAARLKLVVGRLLENGITHSRIHTKSLGTTRSRSGCPGGFHCTEVQNQLDRVVMYKVMKQ